MNRRRHRRGERGIALMLVLSAIAVLTVAGVEFAYNTNVALHLAQNEHDRLKAYYLAKSAFQFMLLELKFDRVFREIVERQNLGQLLGGNAHLPLCQQFPLSTGLIRLVFVSPEGGGGEGGEGTEEIPDELKKTVSLAQEQGAEEFLSFDGDFDGECIDESTKINLNIFAWLKPDQSVQSGLNPYQQQKQFFVQFLKSEQFSDLFGRDDEYSIDDVVTNIADWVDTNETTDSGVGGGQEMSLYDRANVKYRVRNEKMLTLMEAHQVVGVQDNWFGPLQNYFTIYGDGKVNPCTSPPAVVEALIRRYIEATPGLPPVRIQDPEVMERLMKAVTEGCGSGVAGAQLAEGISRVLETAITATNVEFQQENTTNQNQQTSGGFKDYLTGSSRYYTLNLSGQVFETTVHIKAVVDVNESDPTKWPLLYWKVY